MAAFEYRYGDYTHEDGEITDFRWEVVPNHTTRGARHTTTVRATLKGQFLGCTYSEIYNKIHQFGQAYQTNGRKFGLYHPDGSPTKHIMDPADQYVMVGPRVVLLDFPDGTMEELVVKREFTVVLETIRDEAESQIIFYDEKITHIGVCGPIWAAQNTMYGPRSYIIWPASTQTIVQEGSSVGFHGYYLAGAVPIMGWAYEHLEKRIDEPGKPLHLGKYFVYYPWRWRFEFETDVPWLMVPP